MRELMFRRVGWERDIDGVDEGCFGSGWVAVVVVVVVAVVFAFAERVER